MARRKGGTRRSTSAPRGPVSSPRRTPLPKPTARSRERLSAGSYTLKSVTPYSRTKISVPKRHPVPTRASYRFANLESSAPPERGRGGSSPEGTVKRARRGQTKRVLQSEGRSVAVSPQVDPVARCKQRPKRTLHRTGAARPFVPWCDTGKGRR